MDKPKDLVQIKLSAEDVQQAIEDYLNKKRLTSDITCMGVFKTRAKEWFLVIAGS